MTLGGNSHSGEKVVIHVDADLEDLMPGFLENRRKDVVSILKALGENDYETIRVLGHTMRGSGGGYGLDVITDIGAFLEQAAKEKNLEEIKKQVEELSKFLERLELRYE